MKKIFIAFSLLCCAWLSSCKKDVAIGDPVPMEPDYILPQGNASQAANDKIRQLFNTYGSYFLYSFTQKDFEWAQFTSTGAGRIDTAVLGKPEYAEDMLNFLNDIWLKFLPDNFKKGGGIPYRVFMTDSIRQYRVGFPPGYEYLYFDYKVNAKSIAFTGMNQSLRTMTPDQKLAKKNLLISVIFNYYLANNYIDVPASFYNVSNYVTMPATPLNAANPANVEAYRQRGFLPGSYLANGNPSEWHNGNTYIWSTAKTSDINSFLLNITQRNDAQMASYLTYPLIKQKWDILMNHFQSKFGIDVRAIANATY